MKRFLELVVQKSGALEAKLTGDAEFVVRFRVGRRVAGVVVNFDRKAAEEAPDSASTTAARIAKGKLDAFLDREGVRS